MFLFCFYSTGNVITLIKTFSVRRVGNSTVFFPSILKESTYELQKPVNKVRFKRARSHEINSIVQNEEVFMCVSE